MATKVGRPTPTVKSVSQMRDELVSPDALKDVIEYTRDCIRANPEAAALWCFGIGFVLGWKLKPW